MELRTAGEFAGGMFRWYAASQYYKVNVMAPSFYLGRREAEV